MRDFIDYAYIHYCTVRVNSTLNKLYFQERALLMRCLGVARYLQGDPFQVAVDAQIDVRVSSAARFAHPGGDGDLVPTGNERTARVPVADSLADAVERAQVVVREVGGVEAALALRVWPNSLLNKLQDFGAGVLVYAAETAGRCQDAVRDELVVQPDRVDVGRFRYLLGELHEPDVVADWTYREVLVLDQQLGVVHVPVVHGDGAQEHLHLIRRVATNIPHYSRIFKFFFFYVCSQK